MVVKIPAIYIPNRIGFPKNAPLRLIPSILGFIDSEANKPVAMPPQIPETP